MSTSVDQEPGKNGKRITRILIPFLLFAVLGGLAAVVLYVGNRFSHGRAPQNAMLDYAISPAGDIAVFTANGEGGSDLYLMSVKTKAITPLAATPDFEMDPCFTPDGINIVYAAGVAEDRANYIAMRRRDGSAPRKLTTGDYSDRKPAVSPDGRRIVFSRARRYVLGAKGPTYWTDWAAYTIKLDGTQLQQGQEIDTAGRGEAPRCRFAPGGKVTCEIGAEETKEPPREVVHYYYDIAGK